MRFVLAVHLITECLARGIEDHGDMFWLIFIDQLVQHIEYANDRAGRFTVRIGQWRERVIRAKQVRRAVDEDKGRL